MNRILHVVRSLRPETGGLAEAVQNLAAAQRRGGDAASIASLDPADEDIPNVRVLGRSSHGYGYSPDLVPWLRAHAGDFDVVVVHGLWQYQSFGVWRALRTGPVPYVVFPHGMLDVWFKRAYPLKHAKKWLYWPWSEYRVLRDAAAVAFTAEEERRRARRSFWLYRARERIVPLGVVAPPADAERQRTAFYAAHPSLRERPFLLFLGRVHPKKGVDLLLRAYARTWADNGHGPVLAIAGPGDEEYRVQLEEEAKRIGLSGRVQWLPMLGGDVKWGAFRTCEAFVLFSHQENLGLAIVEAMACAKPLLISDQIAVCQEIAASGAAIVVPDTIVGASEALRRWRGTDAAARAAMGDAAEKCFRQRFEIGRAAETLIALFKEIKSDG